MAPTYADDKLASQIILRQFPDNMIRKDIIPEIKYHADAKVIGSSLFAMKGKEVSQKPCTSPKFFCYEQEPMGRWFYLAAAIVAANTVWTIDDGAAAGIEFLKVNDIIELVKSDFTAREQVRVTTAPVTPFTSVTVARAQGTSLAADWDDDTPCRVLFNASKEDSSAPTIKSVIPTEEYNYINIIRNSMGGTVLFLESDLLAGGTPLEQIRLSKWLDHLEQKVNACLFSERKLDTSDGSIKGEGLIPAIARRGGAAQNHSVNGVITFDAFLDIMSDAFKVGSPRKIALFPPLMLNALAFWKRQNLVVMNEDEYLNMKIIRVELFDGEIIIFKERLLQGSPSAPKGLYGSAFTVFDPKYVHYRPYKDWDEKLRQDIGLKTNLGQEDEYVSIFGIEIDVITAHLLATGITGYN